MVKDNTTVRDKPTTREEIEDIQEMFPDKINLEDRIRNALKYYKFWTEVRPVKVREYRLRN